MAWKVELSDTAERQVRRLGRSVSRAHSSLSEGLEGRSDARSSGKVLHGSRLGGPWCYRVGDYRLICRTGDKITLVLVLELGLRSRIYRG